MYGCQKEAADTPPNIYGEKSNSHWNRKGKIKSFGVINIEELLGYSWTILQWFFFLAFSLQISI